ncbi:MAG: hypothetical protein KDD69_00625 [Bdellovibrionales bacterium]|nr:hypothetical protein [Bdellovibrionales bacterium]
MLLASERWNNTNTRLNSIDVEPDSHLDDSFIQSLARWGCGQTSLGIDIHMTRCATCRAAYDELVIARMKSGAYSSPF